MPAMFNHIYMSKSIKSFVVANKSSAMGTLRCFLVPSAFLSTLLLQRFRFRLSFVLIYGMRSVLLNILCLHAGGRFVDFKLHPVIYSTSMTLLGRSAPPTEQFRGFKAIDDLRLNFNGAADSRSMQFLVGCSVSILLPNSILKSTVVL